MAAQRFAVGVDGSLCLAGGDQALQVAQNGAGLGAGLFVELDQCLDLLAGLGVARGGQAQFAAAAQQAFGDFLERVQVLAQQEHGLGAHAFGGLEFVGRLADTLGQHHELAGSGDFRRAGALLQLQRGDGFGDLQQVRGLPVDGAQRVADLGQDLLLVHHHLGALLGALHQRRDLGQFIGIGAAQRAHAHGVVARGNGAHVARQHAGAVLHVHKGGCRARQRLRDRLGQTLRLHQRLAGGGQLLRRAVGLAQGPGRRQHQGQHRHTQQGGQRALVARGRRAAQQRQGHHVVVNGCAAVAARHGVGGALHGQ